MLPEKPWRQTKRFDGRGTEGLTGFSGTVFALATIIVEAVAHADFLARSCRVVVEAP